MAQPDEIKASATPIRPDIRVGKAGLLDGKRCAIHFITRGEFRERFPRVMPIIDQTLISNGDSSVELAVEIIRRRGGEARE